MQFGSSPRVRKLGYVLLFTRVRDAYVLRRSTSNTVSCLGARRGSNRVTRAIHRASSPVTKTIFRFAIRRPINSSRRESSDYSCLGNRKIRTIPPTLRMATEHNNCRS